MTETKPIVLSCCQPTRGYNKLSRHYDVSYIRDGKITVFQFINMRFLLKDVSAGNRS